MKIFIETLGIESGERPANQTKIQMKLIRDHQAVSLELWNEITNSP
ncbi:MAG: hypothetical protein AB1733_13815 [Thermodesulfobacteriota bacterium]